MTETVYFRADTFRATIYLPRLHELTITNIRKLLRLVFCYDWENEEAIRDTALFLEDIVPESKQAWTAASVRYQQEWRLIEKRTTVRRTRKDIERDAAIRAHNDELTRAVKKAKRQYERWVKIQALWNDTKHKMKIM